MVHFRFVPPSFTLLTTILVFDHDGRSIYYFLSVVVALGLLSRSLVSRRTIPYGGQSRSRQRDSKELFLAEIQTYIINHSETIFKIKHEYHRFPLNLFEGALPQIPISKSRHCLNGSFGKIVFIPCRHRLEMTAFCNQSRFQ